MKYLHTMVRVHDLDASMEFYCGLLGLVEVNRYSSEEGEFTLVYLAAPKDIEQAKDVEDAIDLLLFEVAGLGQLANHRVIVYQKKCLEPLGQSKSDYDIFSTLADRLRFGDIG